MQHGDMHHEPSLFCMEPRKTMAHKIGAGHAWTCTRACCSQALYVPVRTLIPEGKLTSGGQSVLRPQAHGVAHKAQSDGSVASQTNVIVLRLRLGDGDLLEGNTLHHETQWELLSYNALAMHVCILCTWATVW